MLQDFFQEVDGFSVRHLNKRVKCLIGKSSIILLLEQLLEKFVSFLVVKGIDKGKEVKSHFLCLCNSEGFFISQLCRTLTHKVDYLFPGGIIETSHFPHTLPTYSTPAPRPKAALWLRLGLEKEVTIGLSYLVNHNFPLRSHISLNMGKALFCKEF